MVVVVGGGGGGAWAACKRDLGCVDPTPAQQLQAGQRAQPWEGATATPRPSDSSFSCLAALQEILAEMGGKPDFIIGNYRWGWGAAIAHVAIAHALLF